MFPGLGGLFISQIVGSTYLSQVTISICLQMEVMNLRAR